ncbi:fatty acid hydroxylase domain-containing protein 2-like isoform X1 [Daphnia carinata]|uniref:fatty acid hydroxylase domain-containing protein 2-like isoform X1 n=2 Tax=Daphnia carinata TaxID=120202 RepID=UPI00257E0898|nr:fatty acid hydroxylase domain-containing protein 2-like isoform X1 [Daphnia carinata]XP_059352839.1 fatty acid hydroxylase domain-containing protein 2-like isoform X1 [Daphnia carinata]
MAVTDSCSKSGVPLCRIPSSICIRGNSSEKDAVVTLCSNKRESVVGTCSCCVDLTVAMEFKLLGGWQRPLLLASTLILVSIIYGETLTMQLRQFRSASGAALDTRWKKITGYFGNDDFYLYVCGIILSIQIPFWSGGLFFMFLDYYNWPKWTRKYKLQPGTHEPIDLNRLKETIKVVLINQWSVSVPLLVFSYFLKKMTNTMPVFGELPSLQRFFVDFLIFIIVDEIGLYYVHRLMHHPKLYARVHKKHHEWPAPIAITFVYSTRIEFLLNMIPVVLGPMLMNPHLFTLWTWYAFVHLRGLKNHSGYDIPGLTSSEEHNYHHMTSNACFSRSPVLDWIHGTDKGFRAYMARKELEKKDG